MAINIMPLATFSVVGTVTPGPNNLMLTASGVNFGFRRTLPHLMGVWLGFLVMLAVVSLGLGSVFQSLPWLQMALKGLGSLYLLYLAYRIATAGGGPSGTDVGQPIRFHEAALFQYVNPKAWMMAVTLASAFALGERALIADTTAIVTAHGLASLPGILMWTLFGVGLRHWLNEPKRRRLFNYSMAALLVASIAFILMPVA